MEAREEDSEKTVEKLRELSTTENRLIADFEEICVKIDLENFLDIKNFILNLGNTHAKLKEINLEFNEIINSLFPISFEKLTSRKKEEREDVCQFDYTDNKHISFMQSYLSLSPEEAQNRLKIFHEIIHKCLFEGKIFLGEEGNINIRKLISDIFRMLQYDCGKLVLEEMNKNLNNKYLNFFPSVKSIVYQPQISRKFPKEEFNSSLESVEKTKTDSTEDLTVNGAIQKIHSLIEKNKRFCLFEPKERADFLIGIDPNLFSLKLVISESSFQRAPTLSYCLRFISLFHEFVHIGRVMNGIYYKFVPLVPLLKETYQNAEELYAIRLNPEFNENLLRQQLGQKERITHLGIGVNDVDLEKYREEIAKAEWDPQKGNLINLLKDLKRFFVVSAMELGILKSKDLKTQDISKATEFNTQDYGQYRTVSQQRPELQSSHTLH
jgi:hypothetical protein